jgi:hypothetical protein
MAIHCYVAMGVYLMEPRVMMVSLVWSSTFDDALSCNFTQKVSLDTASLGKELCLCVHSIQMPR